MFYNMAMSQFPSWMWAQSAGDNGNDNLENIAIDSNGDVYAVGYYSSQFITFGSFLLENAGSGTNDIFIVKYSDTGDVVWAMSFGGGNDDRAISIAADQVGHLYVTGYFCSSVVHFGSYTLTNTNSYYSNFFLVKFNSDGDVIWAKTSNDSPYNDSFNYVHADNYGNVYTTGGFASYSISLNSTTLYNYHVGYDDILVVKYDSEGNVKWAKSAGGFENDIGNIITSDISGNVWISGQFTSSLLYIESYIHENEGLNDIFITKYDSLGNIQWSQCSGGNNGDFPLTILPDNNGDIFLAGYYKSYYITFGNYTLYSCGSPYGDFFLVKINPEGETVWAINSANSPSSDAINSLCLDSFGDLYATGHFQSQFISFGEITLHNSNPPQQEIFLVKFDNSGVAEWALSAQGDDHDEAFSVALNNNGKIFIGGRFFSETLQFGSIELNNFFPGLNDIFVAEYSILTETQVQDDENGFILFPNPFNDFFEIADQYQLYKYPVEVIIYNILGQCVGKAEFDAGEQFIVRNSNLAEGIYSVRLTQNNQFIKTFRAVHTDL